MKPWFLLTLVLATVGGGFAGLVTCAQLLVGASGRGIGYDLPVVIFLLLYLFVAISGLALVLNPRCTGLALAAVAIQIPLISFPLFIYKFAAGFQLTLAIGSGHGRTGFDFRWFLGSGFTFRIAGHPEYPLNIGINLFALALWWLLWRERRSAASRLPRSEDLVRQ
jgi:hypothetical protein